MDEKKYPLDVDGFDYVSVALMDTINKFPGLECDEKFLFSTVLNEDGLAVIPSSGSYITFHRESITGHVRDNCLYPFTVLYRVSGLNEKRKIMAKEWLDTLGRWLERQAVEIDGRVYQMAKWPVLSGDREITEISRTSPAYLGSINEDKSENWVMNMQIQYRNEYDR